ncbi:Fic family protein [Patescibacteria group bacterium]
MLKNIGRVDAAREVINHSALVPAWEAKFREDALSRTVHHGTHLEGNELSLEQAQRLVRVEATTSSVAAERAGVVGRDRDVQEVINYRRVMDWMDHKIKGKESVKKYTEKMFKEVHKLTMHRILADDQVGEYRKVDVVVRNSKTNEISFRPPSFIEVPYQIEAFFEWLNGEEGREHHPVIRAGIAHYELVRIHPFVDGNGRAARAMSLMVLYSEGYDVKRFFSLEEYYDKNAASYYQALQSVGDSEHFDLTYWLEYYSMGLAVDLDRVKHQVLKISKDMGLKKKLGKQVALSERQIKILESMQNSDGIIRSSELDKMFPDISVDTILRDLKDLINKGLIKKKGKTKGAFYQLKQ